MTRPIKTYEELLLTYPEVRKKTHIPFGYTSAEKEGDPTLLVPDPALISLLDQALDQSDSGSSLKSVTEWLNSQMVLHGIEKTITGAGYHGLRVKYRPQYLMKPKVIKIPVKLTREQRLERIRKLKIASEKRRITAAQKRQAKLEGELKTVQQMKADREEDNRKISDSLLMEIDYGTEEYQEIIQELTPVFKPNPGPQTTFFAATEMEVLYGGAAGGGKSYALIADPMRYFDNKNFRGLILRRTNDELRELIWKTQELYPQCFPKSIWREKDKEWRFPSGARLWMTFLEQEKDVLRYQGQAFTYVGFDELTQYPSPHAWDYMRSRLRDASGTVPLFMRACVDEGDVLTSTGWKNIKDIKIGELVQSIDNSGNLILKPVTGFHEYTINEPLVRIRKKNLYMSMTPDHRVFHKKSNSSQPKLQRWNKITAKSVSVVRTSTSYTATGWSHPIICPEFLGLYIAEGCFNTTVRDGNYKVIITQNKIQNHEFVWRVMKKTGLSVNYSQNGDFQITNKFLREYVSQFGKSHEKHFPRDFLDHATKDQLKLAFDAYALGDGHWSSEKSCSLFTCSPQLKDDLCEIAIKLGYKVQVAYQELENINHNNRYIIYVSLRGDTTKVDKNLDGRNDQSFETYDGQVYCLSVQDTENFVIRQNGYVWISGNTSNPGGPGHGWVKKMFIDPSPYGQPFDAQDGDGKVMIVPEGDTDFPESRWNQPLFQRRFIPAKLSDNPHLSKDGNYKTNLLSLREDLQRQLLHGDWDVADGAAFSEFRQAIHVIKPFDVPKMWRRFRSCDFGYSERQASAVHWYAINPTTAQLIVYRELYVNKHTGYELAKRVLELEESENISYGVLDSSVWAVRGQSGPSIAEEMINFGCRWRPSDRSQGSRIAGKNRLHQLLRVDPFNKQPGIVFFENCRQIISDLPVIPSDKDSDDIDPSFVSDHAYDSIRYGIMTRPNSYSMFELDQMDKPRKRYTPSDSQFGY